MAHGPNPARQKNHPACDLCDCGNLWQYQTVLRVYGTRDKSGILVLDISYKNILNENKHATLSIFGSIYLACKILINESHQPISICKIFNRLRAIRPKGFRARSLQSR